jgi:DNA modification methylase
LLQDLALNTGNEIAIHYVPLDDLADTFLIGNSKKHDTDKLIESIQRYGFRDPIAFDINLNKGTGGIVEGNGRLEALLEMRSLLMTIPRGVKEGWIVPVIFGVNATSESEAVAFSVEHNWSVLWGAGEIDLDFATSLFDEDALKEQLEWLDAENSLPLSIESNIDELIDRLDNDGTERAYSDLHEDEIPQEVETRVKKGDIWQLGKHRVYCGDSTDKVKVKEFLGDRRVEMLFTSPPYADLRTYEKGTDLSLEKITSFIPAWREYANYLVVNLGLKFQNHEVVPYWQEYLNVSQKNNLKLLAWNVWDKKQAGSIAHATNMFCLTHEWLFVFGEKAKNLNRTIPNQLDKYEQRHGKNVLSDGILKSVRKADDTMFETTSCAYTHHQIHSVLNLFPELSNIRKEHPAVYPVGLPLAYIEAMTNPKDIIADCFLGSGTTLIASEQCDRICYGTELSENYCDVILTRWEKLTGQTAVLEKNIEKYDRVSLTLDSE